MGTFDSGGLSIAYDDIASEASKTVFLVHGFATNRSENWRRLGWYGAFERKGYRIVALDLRGHGESAKPHDQAAYGAGAMLGDILGLMDHLGLWRVDLMGYSMGARLALQTALAHPSRVSTLIVGGVGGRMFEPPPASEQPAMTMAEAMTAEDPESIKDATLRGFRLFAEQQGEDRLALAAVTQGRGGAAIAKEDLAAIAMPALVVAGQRDQMAGDPQALADLIPGAKAVTLPACDHFSAIPHALFKAAVFDFLDGWLE